MNREMYRKYIKTIRKDKAASICPQCNKLAKFYSYARGEKDTVLKCEVCNQIVREGPELTKLVPLGIYSPMELALLDLIIRKEKEHNMEELNNDQENSSKC